MAWITVLPALEILGRRRSSEWHDLAAVVVLAVLCGFTVARHRKRPYRWIDACLARIRRGLTLLSNHLLVWGVDLRGGASVPIRRPRRYGVLLAVLLALNSFLLWRREWFPDAAADLFASAIYTAYVLLLGVLWMILIFVSLAFCWLVAAAGQGEALRRGWSRGAMIATMVAAVAAVVPAALLLPVWLTVVLAIGAPVLLGVASHVFRTPPVDLLWRRSGELWTCHRWDGRWVNVSQLLILGLALAVLVQVALGERLLDPTLTAGSRPITRGLGLLFSWTAAAGMVAFSVLLLIWFLRCGRETRGRPDHLPTSAEEMALRHRLLSGFEELFRRIADRTFQKGEGFWIGLQHWFVFGLSRDTEEEDPSLEDSWFHSTVGPPYDVLFSREVRYYYARVMASLDIDLIFLEDGVEKRFREVLNVLFGVYDRSGGSERIEERHFAGLPGLRAVIHDFDMAEPLFSTGYSEPDYADIGRARILHVFAERPEGEEPDLPPAHVTSRPLVSSLV